LSDISLFHVGTSLIASDAGIIATSQGLKSLSPLKPISSGVASTLVKRYTGKFNRYSEAKMSQPNYIHALALPEGGELDPEMERYLNVCQEKLGMVPNVLKTYTFNGEKLKVFVNFYNDLMLADSKLSKLEREMIAVVVSSINNCFYCLVAHGAAVRQLSGDPVLGELLVMNYRVAELTGRQRAMLDFAAKLTESPNEIEESDRQALRDVGLGDEEIFDVAAVAGFFNMTNRVASGIDMMPNKEYHSQAR